MKLPEPPQLRELNRDDEQEVNLVISMWLRSYTGSRKGGAEGSHVPKNVAAGVEASVFNRIYQPVVKDLISRSRIVCAASKDDSFVYGFMAWEGDTLHYIAVKLKWVRLGLATWMLDDWAGKRGIVTSHRTTDWLRFCKSKPEAYGDWRYDALARFNKEKAA